MPLPASKILRNPVGSNSFLTHTLRSKCYGHLQMTCNSAMIYPQLASTDCLAFFRCSLPLGTKQTHWGGSHVSQTRAGPQWLASQEYRVLVSTPPSPRSGTDLLSLFRCACMFSKYAVKYMDHILFYMVVALDL